MGTSPRAEFLNECNLWEDLILPPSVRDQLRCAWCTVRDTGSQKQMSDKGIRILLWGPPGTGKTKIAQAFGDIPGVQPFRLWAGDFRAQYIGQSMQRVRELFSKVRGVGPSIMCVDMEQGPYSDNCLFAPRGSAKCDSMTMEIVVETCMQLDDLRQNGPPVSLIGECFAPDRLDSAILSQMDIQIEIPLPDEADRCEILRRKLKARMTDPALDIEAMCELLAKRTPRKSGRDLESLVSRALRRASQGDTPDSIVLTGQDLLSALDRA